MNFYKMVELLQNKEQGYIILINNGNFYIARGRDAILLNKILDLKLSCAEKDVCKVGFPLTALEKYKKLIKRERYSYIIYNFDRTKFKIEKIEKYDGPLKNDIKENKKDCYICKSVLGGYTQKENKYLKAVEELYMREKNEGK